MDKRLQVIREVRQGQFFAAGAGAPMFLGFGRTGRMSYMLTTVRGASVIVDLPETARSTSEISTTARMRHINTDDFR